MKFEEYALVSRVKIEKILLNFLDKKQKETPKVFHQLQIIKALRGFLLKGKLIRGTLFLFSCEMFGRKITPEFINVACAIELTHSALLIHDDIIDNDYIRRGGATIFAQYIERGKEISTINPTHYGTSIGIVIGDIAIFFAQELMGTLKDNSLGDVLSQFAKDLYLVGVAEALDSEYGQSYQEPTMDEIYSVYQYKTARYTFSMPFLMAAIVCNVSLEQKKVIDKLGELIGIIFQIKDDEMSLFGDEKKIGKPVGSDIKENKKTIFREHLYKDATIDEKIYLNTCFGNENLTTQELKKVLSLMKKYKILENVQKEIGMFSKEITKLFNKLEIKKEYKNSLLELLKYNVVRSS